MFEFFILKLLIDNGPLTELEIQRRVHPRLALLNSLALRTGKPSIGPLSEVLRSLQLQQFLKSEESAAGLMYSLTTTGRQRVEAESARHNQMLSDFMQSGEMDGSFQRFLHPRQPFNRS